MELKQPTSQPIYQTNMTFSLDRRERQKALSRVIARIRESLDIDIIFTVTVTEVRQLLNTDRVGVFRFDKELDCQGEFIYEDVDQKWVSALSTKLHEHYCAEDFTQLYQEGRIKVISDIYQDINCDCQVKSLEKFQVRANIAVPLIKGKDLWGLLCIHQCSQPRQWEESEIEFVQLISEHLGVALQQADYIEQVKLQSAQLAQAKAREKSAEHQKTIAKTIEKIRQSLDLESIFRTTTDELRHLLNVDRAAIYRFNPDWSGEFVFESVAEGWVKLMDEQLQRPEIGDNISECKLKDLVEPPTDTYLQDTGGGRFAKGEVYRVCDDIYNCGFNNCYIQVLESYQAKAYVIIAILYNHKIWGLLAVYQNTQSRDWQQDEVYLLTQVSSQLGVALQQAEYLQTLRKQASEISKAAERQRALVNTVDKIRQSLDIDIIFKTTTQEVGRLLEVERVAIYRFHADWSGEFVADSILDNWTTVAKPQPITELVLLQETKAGKYARNEVFVPISQGEKLWGLLVAYQNSQPRYWQEEEINLLAQVGVQLGVAIQQAESLKQMQIQKEEIAQTLKELQRTQSKLIQSEKMAGLGQLIAGLAHEINNPISFIYGNIPYVTDHVKDLLNLVRLYQNNYPQAIGEIQDQLAEIDLDFINDDLPKMLNSMMGGADRIRQLVISLRTFSRLDEAEMKPVNLHEGIDSTLSILQHRFQQHNNTLKIAVIKEYGELPPIVCYAAQMNQVFMNLLTNALDGLKESFTESPKIWIRTKVIDNIHLQICIADNGCGIAENVRDRIFEPFFTTKEPGQGSGLGLSVSYQIIVEKHGGQIKCISELGKGCEFIIEMPIQQNLV
ncbi:GAF domain-containing protein [Anabaena sp. UHCC 0204]|uniref:GAF domain-containing protein n=1 Tax=Anabaena sp. UHCC 0204 TaxID=2590009 RepID=UPI001444F055|nr:GAF domain-containing protein [Anabaena sp. UHCC 0204]MTJ07510.1 GAF domain-containing sensor histidine kinase [Anabaena sp. UHCC 0204]